MYDCHHVQSLVSTGVLNIMKDTFSVIALVSVMFYQNWKLALFAILMMPLAAGLAKSLGKRIGKATAKAGVSSGNLASFLTEIFKGSRMIRIYQKEKQGSQKPCFSCFQNSCLIKIFTGDDFADLLINIPCTRLLKH